MKKSKKIAVVQPPYFKIVGSHNDKLSPSLLFLATRLKERGEDVVIINADAIGSKFYLPWRDLYRNFKFYEHAVEQGSAVMYEAFEKIMQYKPDIVILEAGDILQATVDTGSPFTAMHLAKIFKETGIKVYGFGPLWHEGKFDIEIWHENILPLPVPDFSLIPEDSKYDVVFTKIGCPYKCTFCIQPKYIGKWVDVSRDVIKAQLRLDNHYIEDPVFDPAPEVVDILKGRSYTCETRVDKISYDWIKRAKRSGVKIVKLGAESAIQSFLDKTKKGIKKENIEEAVNMLKEAGLKVVVYILLGYYGVTEKDYLYNLEFFRKLDAYYYVINTTCTYGRDKTDWKFETHFSPKVAEFWGLSEKLVSSYFELQEGKVNPTLI